MTTAVNRHVPNDELSDDGMDEYHAADDDRDSLFSQALADGEPPSDGGQHPRSSIPRETFVQNSFVTAEAESKAREAAQERAAALGAASLSPTHNSHPPARQSPAQSSAPSSAWQPHAQQHGHVAPPPDYQTAISNRSVQPSVRGTTSSGPTSPISPATYGTMGSESTSAFASRQGPNGGTWPFHGEPNPFGANRFPTQDMAAPFLDQNNFNHNHPFVRNGLFGERGLFGEHTAPSSMRDAADHSRQPVRTQEASHEQRVDEESGLLESQRPSADSHSDDRRGGKRRREFQISIKTRDCCRCNRWVKWLIAFALLLFILFGSRGIAEATGDGDIDWKGPKDSDTDDRDWMPAFNMSACSRDMSPAQQFALGIGGFRSFSIVEMMEQSNDGPSNIGGLIDIRQGRSNQTSDLLIYMSAQTSREWVVESLNYDLNADSIEFRYPTLKRVGRSASRGCMTIGIIIEVKPGVSLEGFGIDSAHCSIRAAEGLFADSDQDEKDDGTLLISGKTSLSTASGSIHLPYWSSRETYVRTISGSIRGDFELLDIVDLRSSSGSIHVDVVPKSADRYSERPASLVVETISGSIDVQQPQTDLPAREYSTSVRSSGGHVSGSYILGREARFTTISGSLTLEILPYSNKVDRLFTESSSGSHTVRLLSPYSDRSASPGDISHLDSSHKSISGSLKLTYPQEWTGAIDAYTLSSSVFLRGKNVKVDSAGSFKPIHAHKGTGHSEAKLRSSSGSIDMVAGDN